MAVYKLLSDASRDTGQSAEGLHAPDHGATEKRRAFCGKSEKSAVDLTLARDGLDVDDSRERQVKVM
eukprot:CAMPEP_0178390336 /NCGR_PEP_ID=MMETSP0689_2-20121128/10594_1 /TAXON_ID=160604 /ORGANISM="Amphidinium massartii, Strain CS-259" /LENGTH=66 /DNA_ID=CAMNT_0020010843 /DNA_START=732 /DNA_END=933 /DNA_ORIENTATION=+